MKTIDADKVNIYRYMNFNQIDEYNQIAEGVDA